ncbi:MAG: PAS domain S-box protein, partial [Deltaproteobacteria bacterium]|nr:PAS domain S-box protein [Deltaproteobacteria bacterium]
MAVSKIMILEDPADDAEHLQNILESLGYAIHRRVGSGSGTTEEGLADNPDLLLVNVPASAGSDGLRSSKERFRLYLDNTMDIIFTVDRELRLVDVSSSASRILGYSLEELIGVSIPEIKSLTPESKEKALKEINLIFQGKKIEASEYAFFTKDGAPIILELSSSPLM